MLLVRSSWTRVPPSVCASLRFLSRVAAWTIMLYLLACVDFVEPIGGCVRLIASGVPHQLVVCDGASLGHCHATRMHGRTATYVMHRVTLLL